MSLLAASCLIAGIAVAIDAVRTELQDRRLSPKHERSLSSRYGLPEQE